ncbi:hypothetical protein EYV94_20080 [Puteibacter caeruleilacunae]|nr:hypothetical protein EYV94_20080 [Puteibacter caeruleilacunae]
MQDQLAERNSLFSFAVSKLEAPTMANKKMLSYHIFNLKMNDDFVVKSEQEVEELIEYINNHQ